MTSTYRVHSGKTSSLGKTALLLAFLTLALPVAAPVAGEPKRVLGHEGGADTVQIHGALRAMMHQGQTGQMVKFDTLLPDASLYGLGALTDLAGEITIIDGVAYLTFASGEHDIRSEVSTAPTGSATLLATGRVNSWIEITITEDIRFEDLDARVAALATEAGVATDRRLLFLVQGTVRDLQWHVIDGTRLAAGPSSHQEHQNASVVRKSEETPATLVGFYSPADQGVFTHMGSRTHVHAVLHGPPATGGHVDHVVIPAGATLRLPG